MKNENVYLYHQYDVLKKDFDTLIKKRFDFEENQFLDMAVAIKNERERIARELHDDLMQRLVAIRFRLEQLTYYSLKLEVEQEINRLREELDSTMRDARYIIENLVQSQFENDDLNELITQLVSRQKLITRIKFNLFIESADRVFEIPLVTKKELFLMTQEAVNNAIKHSAGSIIEINVSWNDDLVIEIFNDGVGFLKSRLTGVGLLSMKERCAKIGANFQAFNKMGRFHAVVLFKLPRNSNKPVAMSISN